MSALKETRKFDFAEDGRLVVPIYGQDGQMVHLTAKDSPDTRRFVVWLRKFDRAGKQESV